MRAIEVQWDYLSQLNCIPLGMSVDSQPCKKAWAEALQLNKLSLPSDFWPHGKTAMDYGVFIEDKGISERANIIIDENGKVTWVKVYPISQLPDLTEVILALELMQ